MDATKPTASEVPVGETLSKDDASALKDAILAAISTADLNEDGGFSPKELAESAIDAFRLIDRASDPSRTSPSGHSGEPQ